MSQLTIALVWIFSSVQVEVTSSRLEMLGCDCLTWESLLA